MHRVHEFAQRDVTARCIVDRPATLHVRAHPNTATSQEALSARPGPFLGNRRVAGLYVSRGIPGKRLRVLGSRDSECTRPLLKATQRVQALGVVVAQMLDERACGTGSRGEPSPCTHST